MIYMSAGYYQKKTKVFKKRLEKVIKEGQYPCERYNRPFSEEEKSKQV